MDYRRRRNKVERKRWSLVFRCLVTGKCREWWTKRLAVTVVEFTSKCGIAWGTIGVSHGGVPSLRSQAGSHRVEWLEWRRHPL
jgi:hypothetical protein